LIRNK
jgi:hypothetical protein